MPLRAGRENPGGTAEIHQNHLSPHSFILISGLFPQGLLKILFFLPVIAQNLEFFTKSSSRNSDCDTKIISLHGFILISVFFPKRLLKNLFFISVFPQKFELFFKFFSSSSSSPTELHQPQILSLMPKSYFHFTDISWCLFPPFLTEILAAAQPLKELFSISVPKPSSGSRAQEAFPEPPATPIPVWNL